MAALVAPVSFLGQGEVDGPLFLSRQEPWSLSRRLNTTNLEKAGSASATAVEAAIAMTSTVVASNLTTHSVSLTTALPPFFSGVDVGISSSASPAPACELLSTSFGWWLQALLGAVCFVSLVGKRFTDKIRRPWKIWFFDTSKQGLSALVIHFVNILLSMAFGEWLDADADPCNWYWINLTLDDTLGVACQYVLLRTLQCFYRMQCVGRPELAMSGEYGDPPSSAIFGRQLLDWQGLVIIQKVLLATLVINFTDEVATVADVLLGWLDPRPKAKLVVVMVITPLTMNVFALWIADSFLQGGDSLSDTEDLVVKRSSLKQNHRGGGSPKHGPDPCVLGGSPKHGLHGDSRSRNGNIDINLSGNSAGGEANCEESSEESDLIGFQEWMDRSASDNRSSLNHDGRLSPPPIDSNG